MRRQRLFACGGVAVAVACVGALPAPALPLRGVAVEVVTPRLAYLDGSMFARFSAEAGCLPPEGPARADDDALCGHNGHVRGRISGALLGFSVVRDIDARGGEAVPVLDSGWAAGTERTLVVAVETQRVGHLEVTANAATPADIGARFIATSATPATPATATTAQWAIDAAPAGLHTFTIDLDVPSGASHSTGFVPQVGVTLTTTGQEMLRSRSGAAFPAAPDGSESGTVTMTQRLSPARGQPTLAIEDFHPHQKPSSELPHTWTSSLNVDTAGTFAVGEFPAQRRRLVAPLRALTDKYRGSRVEGLVGPTLHGTVTASLPLDFSSLHINLETTNPDSNDGAVAADGEAATLAYAAQIGDDITARAGLPEDDAGRLAATALGPPVASAWSSQELILEMTDVDGTGTPAVDRAAGFGLAQGAISVASVTVEAAGGDVDARTARLERQGTPVYVTAPSGEHATGVTTFLSNGTQQGLRLVPEFERLGGPLPNHRVRLTPVLDAGDYWLEPSEAARNNDWQAQAFVVLESATMTELGVPTESKYRVRVQPGTTMKVSFAAPSQGNQDEVLLQPGEWTVQTGRGGVSVEQLHG